MSLALQSPSHQRTHKLVRTIKDLIPELQFIEEKPQRVVGKSGRPARRTVPPKFLQRNAGTVRRRRRGHRFDEVAEETVQEVEALKDQVILQLATDDLNRVIDGVHGGAEVQDVEVLLLSFRNTLCHSRRGSLLRLKVQPKNLAVGERAVRAEGLEVLVEALAVDRAEGLVRKSLGQRPAAKEQKQQTACSFPLLVLPGRSQAGSSKAWTVPAVFSRASTSLLLDKVVGHSDARRRRRPPRLAEGLKQNRGEERVQRKALRSCAEPKGSQ